MKMKIVAVVLAVIIFVLLGVLLFVQPAKSPTVPIPNASSTDSGILKPGVSPDGHVEVSAPLANDRVVSSFTVTGNVTGGGWFFEASFPVKVVDADGTVLGQGPAQAMSDWTSTDTVPFVAKIIFANPHSATGTVVLSKDNPSGLPQNAESFGIPIRFGVSTTTLAAGKSGVRGVVTLGPTCPVERIPPDPQCAPKPYETTILIFKKGGSAPIETISTNASGSFSAVLSAGIYTLEPYGASVYPRCSPVDVAVLSDAWADVSLTCDTGIR